LRGGEDGCRLDLGVVGKALLGKGMAPEDAPPPLNQIEPAGVCGGWCNVDAEMGCQPFLDGRARVTGEVISDQVEVSLWVIVLHRIEQRLEACGVARGSCLRECLSITDAQGTIDPHFVGPTTIIQRCFDPVTIGRPAGGRRGGSRRYRAKLVNGEDRRSL